MEQEQQGDFSKKLPLIIGALALVLALAGLYLAYTAKDKADSNQASESQISAQIKGEIAAEKARTEAEARQELQFLQKEASALNNKIEKSKKEIAWQSKKDSSIVSKELKKSEANITATERSILQQLTRIHQQINNLNERIDLTNQRINALQKRLASEGV